MSSSKKIIYTIGHSTHTFQDFLAMLQNFRIEVLVDIRSYPGSRRFPQFNKENLAGRLPEYVISYLHLPSLGGRRKTSSSSKNTAWKNDAFRGYADYMETENFTEGIKDLAQIALKTKAAYMCSEALWWRCHRSLVSDYLKANGWKVMHIINSRKAEEHHYTEPAKIIGGKLSYGTSQTNIEF
ncbi:MAG: DUF488 domain-containing protein [Bacteroidota bacterium]|nr:DUF488 domain-containing protein [Bacteroidota bacterium]MDQ6890537.1 DUF488 domain-containing protein [Bacteroidota bacterium]